MSKHEPSGVDSARRGFLRLTGSAGAIGAVAILMGRSAAAEAASAMIPAPAAEAPAGGYRETEHIRKYYYCAAYW
jgi:hypothetical protein